MLSQVVINQGNFALQNRAENVVQTVVHCFSIMLSNKLIINRIIPLSQSPLGSRKTKKKIKQIPDNQSLSGIFIFSKYCISPQKTVMITGEIGGLDIYLKKSTELDHISLIFRILRGSKPTRKN